MVSNVFGPTTTLTISTSNLIDPLSSWDIPTGDSGCQRSKTCRAQIATDYKAEKCNSKFAPNNIRRIGLVIPSNQVGSGKKTCQTMGDPIFCKLVSPGYINSECTMPYEEMKMHAFGFFGKDCVEYHPSNHEETIPE